MKILLILFLTLAMSVPAWADSSCYSPAELEAEHLLRLHSELMVITVTCRTSSQGESLVPSYTGFTKKNVDTLSKAEKIMKIFFNNHGGDGENRLDRLRTKLANEFGQKIADMSSQPFCDAYRDKVLTYYRANSAEVAAEVKRMEADEKAYVKPCGVR